MYAILHNTKHNTTNTKHLILAAVTWLSCRCANSRQIWRLSAKFWVNRQITIKPPQPNLTRIRPMQPAAIYGDRRTDGHDDGCRLFVVCANVPKDAVNKQNLCQLHICPLATLILQSSVIITSLRYPCWRHKYQQTRTAQYMYFVLRFVIWHIQRRAETFVIGWCTNGYSISLSAAVVYGSTDQDGGLFMLIQLTML